MALAAVEQSGWDGVTREQVRIDFGKGWVTNAELTYPSGTDGRLPLVVFLHGSGRNDMNQTLPDGKGSTFVPLAQGASREGFATLRFNLVGQPKETVDHFRPILLDGERVSAATDRNLDGQIAIDAEAGPVLRKATHIDDYPNIPGLDEYTIAYATDLARFPTVTQALPKSTRVWATR